VKLRGSTDGEFKFYAWINLPRSEIRGCSAGMSARYSRFSAAADLPHPFGPAATWSIGTAGSAGWPICTDF